ncbi:response regulator transcription factor [Streptomyces sp. NBC_00453]|uniref:response regulator transcription factor n=1 Tax=Streptomyces sp. NBC_00453 TaxID=2903653 RepID=UPI002E1C3B12
MRMPAAPDRSSRLRVLVVEDDDTIGRHLESGLLGHDYAPTWCRTGASALAEATRAPYDVLLLDLGLPDMDGLDVARYLRPRLPDLLIVVLTARTEDIDVIAGLDAGADDYLVKPFSLTVLLARLRAHLRRHAVAPPARDPVRLGDLVVDVAAPRCALHGVEVPLRAKEFDLLAVLAERVGEAVSREALMAEVWDENWFGSTKTLDGTMAGLRRRLTEATEAGGRPARLPEITTLRGHGYCWTGRQIHQGEKGPMAPPHGAPRSPAPCPGGCPSPTDRRTGRPKKSTRHPRVDDTWRRFTGRSGGPADPAPGGRGPWAASRSAGGSR